MSIYRTHTCGQLRGSDAGKEHAARTALTDEDFENFDYDADPVDDRLDDPTRSDSPPARPPV